MSDVRRSLMDAWSKTGRQSDKVEDRRGKKLTPDERKAATAASFIDSALLGYGDNVLAGAMSLLPGRGTYDEELDQARYLQDQLRRDDPVDYWAARGAGLIGPGGLGGYRAAMNAARGGGSALAIGVPAVASVTGLGSNAVEAAMGPQPTYDGHRGLPRGTARSESKLQPQRYRGRGPD